MFAVKIFGGATDVESDGILVDILIGNRKRFAIHQDFEVDYTFFLDGEIFAVLVRERDFANRAVFLVGFRKSHIKSFNDIEATTIVGFPEVVVGSEIFDSFVGAGVGFVIIGR